MSNDRPSFTFHGFQGFQQMQLDMLYSLEHP